MEKSSNSNNNNNFAGFLQPRPAMVKKVITEVTSSNITKHQTTSTPCHDTNTTKSNPIHDYFISPNTNSSLIGLNGSEFCANSGSRNVPILGNNININNISNSSTNISQEMLSYQRVKKVVYDSAQSNEYQLKEKEQMLNHLKSIDLAKYSFPNENKPRTDYTYAKSSSYLKECKDQANDNYEMPNLCRRARKSPQGSLIANSSSASLLNKSETLSQTSTFASVQDKEIDKSQSEIVQTQGKLSVYEKIKSFMFNKSEENQRRDQDRSLSSSSSSAMASGSRTLPLVRNLHYELDDGRESSKLKMGLSPSSQRGSQPPRLASTSSASNASVSGSSATFVSASTHIYQSTSTSVPNGRENGHLEAVAAVRAPKRNGKLCSRLKLLFLVLLIPFLIFALNKLDEKEHIYERVNKNFLKPYLNLDINEETIHLIKSEIHKSAEYIKYIFMDYLPKLFAIDNIKNQTSFYTQKTTSYLNEIIDYKPSTSGGYEMTKNLFNDKDQDLIKGLNEMKEKLLTETISNINNAKLVDIELIKKELDQKFNYTLTMMSNKLADQLSQFEMSKTSYESDLKKVKDVLNELDSRYSSLINQLRIVDQQRSKQESEQAQVKDTLKETFSTENISFEKIEEYINRTFYVYNADKTGMTDFASESVGASIMFTRCTENYMENAKWVTVFDVPITRITVSPRVVIQVIFIKNK